MANNIKKTQTAHEQNAPKNPILKSFLISAA